MYRYIDLVWTIVEERGGKVSDYVLHRRAQGSVTDAAATGRPAHAGTSEVVRSSKPLGWQGPPVPVAGDGLPGASLRPASASLLGKGPDESSTWRPLTFHVAASCPQQDPQNVLHADHLPWNLKVRSGQQQRGYLSLHVAVLQPLALLDV